MRFLTACLAFTGFFSVGLTLDQHPLAVEKGDPFTDPQAAIRELQFDITDTVKDLAQGNISEALLDYVFTRSFLQRNLFPLVFPDGVTSCKGFKITDFPLTANDAIQLLQKAQVNLQILSRDLTAKAGLETLRQDVCGGVITPVFAVGCYEGGGFAENLNGTFTWICPKFRYNATEIASDPAATAPDMPAVPEADLDSTGIEEHTLEAGNAYTDP